MRSAKHEDGKKEMRTKFWLENCLILSHTLHVIVNWIFEMQNACSVKYEKFVMTVKDIRSS